MSNHVSRFHAAIQVVASHGNIKQRLVAAYEEHLAEIEESNLPAVTAEKFAELRRLMTGVEPLNGEGHIRATVRKMSVPQTDECSRMMVDIYTDLLCSGEEIDEATTINIGEPPRIPAFLVKNLNS